MGPNGSGKSNIGDGIRWVLGETSAKSLRGGSMKDVIFSGCLTRKPSTSAEVTLEFDNTTRILPKIDDDTVIITRKVNINGKSEYYINHQIARLRDIQEIFLDTGLGSSSYSMIGQEQTKKLLSENTEERRAIFEEAAGIVKMKSQKENTEKRLDQVAQDFVRLNDISKELERQVKPLQKQSEKAKQYLSIKKVLDETETDFLAYKFKRLKKDEEYLTNELKTNKDELTSASSLVTKMDEKLKSLKEQLKTTNEDIFLVQEEKSTLKEQIDSNHSQLEINKEKLNQSNLDIDESQNEIREIEEKFSVSIDEFNTKKERYKSLDRLIESKKEQKDKLGIELFNHQTELNSLKDKSDRLRQEISSLYNDFQEAKIKFEQHHKEEESILKELDKINNLKENSLKEITNAQNKLTEKESVLKDHQAKLSSLTVKLQNKQTSLELKKNDLNGLSSEIINLETQLAKDKATLESLETSLENFEGYFEGVKNTLKNKHRLSGVLDVVSNLFEPNDGYEIALDSLLNSISQNIVVDTIENAKEAVNFLKNNKLGRATFIPLDDVTEKSLSKEELTVLNTFTDITPALSVISYQSALSPLFKHLLGRYLIAKDMDAAVKLYGKTKIKTKIVTLDGDILQPGVISGGARNKKGLISKKKEMDTLKVNVNAVASNLQELYNHKNSLEKDISTLNYELSVISPSLEEEKEINNDLKLDLESFQRNFSSLKNGIKEQEITEKDLKYRYDESKRMSSSLYSRHQEKEQLHNKKNNDLSETLEKIKVIESSLETKKEEETQCVIDIEKMEEEKRNLTDFISEQENGKDSNEKRLEFLQTKKFSNEVKVESLKKENNSIIAILDVLKKEFSSIEDQLSDKQSLKNNIQLEMDQIESSVINERHKVKSLNEEIHKLELKRNNLLNSISQILKRSQEAYQLDENSLLSIMTIEINEEATEREINKLIKELKSIGSVNLESITDFEQLNERYQREKEQLDDIREAKKDLETLLKDISKEMTQRFTTTFKEISKHFETTFVELFGGGEASLKLEDPKNPLSSHILIKAQPPGKKPKRMESLSGGEKNLTSCALVFAIIKTKPSPFIYLDEIDAPLDDANVSRFAYYLKKFGEDTQFIVISHRKGTMMSADSLFGVTQEEQGITTVFPYHLEHTDNILDDNNTKEVS